MCPLNKASAKPLSFEAEGPKLGSQRKITILKGKYNHLDVIQAAGAAEPRKNPTVRSIYV
jgi:hypothetical protein